MPKRPDGEIVRVYAAAASDLVTAASTGAPTRADVRIGATVVRLIADAQAQIDRQRPPAG